MSNRAAWLTDFAPRMVFDVTCSSLAMQLEWLSWVKSGADATAVARWHNQLQTALRQGDAQPLHAETLSIAVDRATRVELPVSALNTQIRAASRVRYPHGHDPEVLAAIDLFLPDDGVLWDVGASWGTFSLATAVRPGFRGEIHAFEPMSRSLADLRRMVEALPQAEAIRIHPIAASDRDGRDDLVISLNSGGCALGYPTEGRAFETVRVQRLDDLGLALPQVVKMDVEGHEGPAMRGTYQTLRAAQPVTIFESALSLDKLDRTMEPFVVLGSLGYSFCWPMWVDRNGRLGRSPEAGSRQRFALVQFAPEERLKSTENCNVVALPRGAALANWEKVDIGVDVFPFGASVGSRAGE